MTTVDPAEKAHIRDYARTVHMNWPMVAVFVAACLALALSPFILPDRWIPVIIEGWWSLFPNLAPLQTGEWGDRVLAARVMAGCVGTGVSLTFAVLALRPRRLAEPLPFPPMNIALRLMSAFTLVFPLMIAIGPEADYAAKMTSPFELAVRASGILAWGLMFYMGLKLYRRI